MKEPSQMRKSFDDKRENEKKKRKEKEGKGS